MGRTGHEPVKIRHSTTMRWLGVTALQRCKWLASCLPLPMHKLHPFLPAEQYTDS
jgi:hypothetical protein